MQIRVEELNHQLKNQLRSRGSQGPACLRQVFQKFDFNSNGKLELSEFEEALASFG